MKHFGTLLLLAIAVAAQTPATRSFVGAVAAFRPEAAEVEVRADNGQPVAVKLTADTIAQRVAPGAKDLKSAETIRVTDLAIGDRVLVTLDAATNAARRIVVMSATDIAKRNEADRADWQKRGVAGVVASKSGNRVTVKTRSLSGEIEAVVIVDDRTTVKRYAPDSVKFTDARQSKVAEIAVGDQLRARGEKSEDSREVKAQELVFGTFVIKAGAVTAVDPAAKSITVKELGTNKPLTIVVTADSQIKLMPSFPGGMMPMPGRGGASSAPPTGGRAGEMPGTGAMPPGASGGFDINQMLERMPMSKLDDLKPGATVVISSTKPAKPDQLTAIMLLGNADMLIQMASAMSASGRGNSSMGVGAGMMGGGMMGSGDMSGGLGSLGIGGIMQ